MILQIFIMLLKQTLLLTSIFFLLTVMGTSLENWDLALSSAPQACVPPISNILRLVFRNGRVVLCLTQSWALLVLAAKLLSMLPWRDQCSICVHIQQQEAHLWWGGTLLQRYWGRGSPHASKICFRWPTAARGFECEGFCLRECHTGLQHLWVWRRGGSSLLPHGCQQWTSPQWLLVHNPSLNTRGCFKMSYTTRMKYRRSGQFSCLRTSSEYLVIRGRLQPNTKTVIIVLVQKSSIISQPIFSIIMGPDVVPALPAYVPRPRIYWNRSPCETGEQPHVRRSCQLNLH